MDKKNLVILLIGILVILWTAFFIINFYSPEPNNLELALKELKKSYDICEENIQGEWCCKEQWEGDILMERECRQFDN